MDVVHPHVLNHVPTLDEKLLPILLRIILDPRILSQCPL